jgi:2,4-dienoyl-CoA reductase-like NADH-dependent reductase (Old Yellow Enzyme family)
VGPSTSTSFLLSSPIRIRGLSARNRIVLSPMCMYASGADGLANDYHLVHLGRMALGGAGIVIAEATAVEARGRVSSGDLGLWSDDHIEPLSRVARFVKGHGAIPGIQLAHAGRKASTQAPWNGNGPLGESDAQRGDSPWQVVGPSEVAAGAGWPVPESLSLHDLQAMVSAWRDAARRATQAGFEVIDIHGAHGYLLHSFLSPISNRRTDHYGGSFLNRMRLALEVVEAVRSELPVERALFYQLPVERALFYRLSAIDGVAGGLELEDSVAFVRELYARGVDVIDTSTGGISTDRVVDTRVGRGYSFHAPFSKHIRSFAGGLVGVVGLIVDAHQAEAVLQAGEADLVFLGRELLSNPNWPHHAQAQLQGEAFDQWHKEAGWWLARRASLLCKLRDSGETPMTRFQSADSEERSG